MNIDLLPFSAFALESCSASAQATGELHTLTLPLDLTPVHPAFQPSMSGSISLSADIAGPGPLHAAVVPASGPLFTLTL